MSERNRIKLWFVFFSNECQSRSLSVTMSREIRMKRWIRLQTKLSESFFFFEKKWNKRISFRFYSIMTSLVLYSWILKWMWPTAWSRMPRARIVSCILNEYEESKSFKSFWFYYAFVVCEKCLSETHVCSFALVRGGLILLIYSSTTETRPWMLEHYKLSNGTLVVKFFFSWEIFIQDSWMYGQWVDLIDLGQTDWVFE